VGRIHRPTDVDAYHLDPTFSQGNSVAASTASGVKGEHPRREQ